MVAEEGFIVRGAILTIHTDFFKKKYFLFGDIDKKGHHVTEHTRFNGEEIG